MIGRLTGRLTLGTRDAEAVDGLLRAVGEAEVMPRFRNLDPAAIQAKTGPLDLVTEADEAAERAIAAGLLRLFPDAVIVGEEAVAADPAVLDRLHDAEVAFLIDPIDGTANYAAGMPLFGIMVAGIVNGEVALAAIHDPVGHDAVRRDTALALRGEGAWLVRGDGQRADLRVAASAPVSDMAGAVAWRFLPQAQQARVRGNLGRVAASFSYRCAAHEYRLAAAGHCHFLLYGRLMPWDHAPGWLLHREAGGYARQLDGSPYVPLPGGKGLLCAPDEDGWHALRAALLADPEGTG